MGPFQYGRVVPLSFSEPSQFIVRISSFFVGFHLSGGEFDDLRDGFNNFLMFFNGVIKANALGEAS